MVVSACRWATSICSRNSDASRETLTATTAKNASSNASTAASSAARERKIVQERTPQPAHSYRVRRFNGSTLLLEVSSVYIEYDGKPAVLSMARDVTARRELERQLVQSERLAALGATIHIGHKASNADRADVVVVSSAVASENPEVQAALSFGALR